MLVCWQVYLVREEKRGMVRYHWIDVTEYETRDEKLDRRGKSPLGYITMMDEKTLLKASTKELFAWKPFQLWCAAKIYPTFYVLPFWITLRLMLIIIYVLVMADAGMMHAFGGVSDKQARGPHNYTFVYCSTFPSYRMSENTRDWLFIYMAFTSFCLLLFDLVEIITIVATKSPSYFYGWHFLRPTVLVTRLLYRCNQFMLAVLIATVSTVYFFDANLTEVTLQIVNVVCMINITFSVMFFFQMLPGVGVYVITIRRMLRDLLNFSVLYLLWVTPFTLYFMIFFNTSSKYKCVKEFSTIGESFYSTFLMMLNMIQLTDYDVYTKQIAEVMHVLYVFTVAILLINFLIAVMSTSAARISQYDHLIAKLERLHISFLVENRLCWFLENFLTRCKGKVIVAENARFQLLDINHC